MAGDEDDRLLRAHLPGPPRQFVALEVGQADIGEEQVDGDASLDGGERALRAGRPLAAVRIASGLPTSRRSQSATSEETSSAASPKAIRDCSALSSGSYQGRRGPVSMWINPFQ